MREIKFRVWNGKMSYPIDTIFPDNSLIEDLKNYKSGNLILQQYTGMKDKNGKDIYEGDVLQFWCSDRNTPYYLENRWTFVVSFQESSFGYTGAKKEMHIGSDMVFVPFYVAGELRDLSDVEVIGNIFENPELVDSH